MTALALRTRFAAINTRFVLSVAGVVALTVLVVSLATAYYGGLIEWGLSDEFTS